MRWAYGYYTIGCVVYQPLMEKLYSCGGIVPVVDGIKLGHVVGFGFVEYDTCFEQALKVRWAGDDHDSLVSFWNVKRA